MNKKLYRDIENKKVLGVLAGLSNYFNVDVSLLRIIYVIMALLPFFFISTFSLVIIYLIAALLIPVKPEEDEIREAEYEEKKSESIFD
ncbi:MAG: PspC domain-containing protein [Bacilli bacterium]